MIVDNRLRVLSLIAIFWLASVYFNIGAWGIVWNKWIVLDSYEHGFIICLICCALLLRLVKADVAFSPPGSVGSAALILIAILLFSGLASMLSLLSIDLLAAAVLPVLLCLGVMLVVGLSKRTARIVAVPLILYTAMPIWDPFSDFLQYLTVLVVSFLLQQFGFVAFIDGIYVHVPAGVFEIAQGCSGLRFFLTAVAITVFWSSYQHCSLRNSAIALLIVIVVSIIVNWLRVFVIVVSGYFFGMDVFIVDSHYFFGWLFFFAAFVLLWVVLDHRGLFEPVERAASGLE